MKIKREVKLALTAIVAIIILIWGINFLKASALFDRNKTFYGIYDQVDGLKVSSSVIYRGYSVGQVSSIKFIGERYDKILVQFSVSKKLEIPMNSKAIIQNIDIMGSKAMNIEPGDSPIFAQDGDTLRSEVQLGLMDQVNEHIQPLKNKAEDIMISLDTILTSIQDIFNSDTRINIHESLSSIQQTLQNVENASGSLDNLVTGQSSRIAAILENIQSITNNLRENNYNIAASIENVSALTDSLRSVEISRIFAQVEHILSQVDSVAMKINHGKGTFGEVVNDDDLYYNLVAVSENLDKLLSEFRANPKKFVNLSVFDFSSNRNKGDNYGIVIIESEKPLPKNQEIFKIYPDLREIRRGGNFLYIINTYKNLKQAEKDLDNVKKTFQNAYIVKISFD